MRTLCSIKERVHAIQRYQQSPFTQSKKGSILFKGINSLFAQSKKGSMLFKGVNTVPITQSKKGSMLFKGVNTVPITQSKKGSMLFKGIDKVYLLNQRKGPCYPKVLIQSICSIKERLHVTQRYKYSPFTQSKKGTMLFNGINTVSLPNQRKGPCYSKVSIQSLCLIKERVHAIQ